MRLALIVLVLSLSISFKSVGQFYQISFTDQKSKDEIINQLTHPNSFLSNNLHFFFKGTSQRTEFTCKDSTLQDCAFRRRTVFGNLGEVLKDSIVGENKIQTSDLVKVDTTWVRTYYVNGNILERDTFIVDKTNKIRLIKEKGEVFKYYYNPMGLLNKMITTRYGGKETTKKEIFYFKDSITISEITSSIYQHETRKRFYYFNKQSLLVTDSSYTISHRFRPPNLSVVFTGDTTNYCTHYVYDKHNRHIKTISRSSGSPPSSFERVFKKNKVISEVNYSSGNQMTSKIIFSYPNRNTIIEKSFRDIRLDMVRTYIYVDKRLREVKEQNNTFEIGQGRLIKLDNKGRIISSCETTGEETDCRKMSYTN